VATNVCKTCPYSSVCLSIGYDELLEMRLVFLGRMIIRNWNDWQRAREGIPRSCPAEEKKRKRRWEGARKRVGAVLGTV